ncbi:unnamed protein product [Adineta steineri]|uniref:Uncharacterized protein n=1 Tax=Adineta steineri TaxID=433720 RepID=A0A814LYN9_9BILA|nr:unnamed protein product [Adineta steineri]CAF1322571.1 unnamed protein product [Adineta steineri]
MDYDEIGFDDTDDNAQDTSILMACLQGMKQFNKWTTRAFSRPFFILENVLDNIQRFIALHSVSYSFCMCTTITVALSATAVGVGVGVGNGTVCSNGN